MSASPGRITTAFRDNNRFVDGGAQGLGDLDNAVDVLFDVGTGVVQSDFELANQLLYRPLHFVAVLTHRSQPDTGSVHFGFPDSDSLDFRGVLFLIFIGFELKERPDSNQSRGCYDAAQNCRAAGDAQPAGRQCAPAKPRQCSAAGRRTAQSANCRSGRSRSQSPDETIGPSAVNAPTPAPPATLAPVPPRVLRIFP